MAWPPPHPQVASAPTATAHTKRIYDVYHYLCHPGSLGPVRVQEAPLFTVKVPLGPVIVACTDSVAVTPPGSTSVPTALRDSCE